MSTSVLRSLSDFLDIFQVDRQAIIVSIAKKQDFAAAHELNLLWIINESLEPVFKHEAGLAKWLLCKKPREKFASHDFTNSMLAYLPEALNVMGTAYKFTPVIAAARLISVFTCFLP